MDKLILDEPNSKGIANRRLAGLTQSSPKLSPKSPTVRAAEKTVLLFRMYQH